MDTAKAADVTHNGRRLRAPATMADVAKKAGVSPKTVSNVVNNFIHISPRTRERVQQAIDELGYQMNLPAQSLRRGRSGALGLAVPDLVNPYFAALVQAVMQEAEKHGLTVFIELTGGVPDKEVAVLTDPLRSMTDGLILATLGLRPNRDERTLGVDFPLVVLGDQLFGAGVTQVTMANVEAARSATQYLIDRGAKRVALLGWNPDRTATSELRYEGYRKALEDNDIEFDETLVLVEPDWTRARGAQAVTKALEQEVDFDAIFSMNDVLALGALHALDHHQILVPNEVQVLGFDNLEESAFSHPPLTTVDPSLSRIATDAVDLLTQQIQGANAAEEPERISEPFRIVGRGSTRQSAE